MKLIVPLALVMVVGFILAAGCTETTDKNTVNTSVNNTTASNTLVPSLNMTVNATATITSALVGSLKVSISGISYPLNLSVLVDNETVGTLNTTTPLYLTVSEGAHTVMVCAGSVCEQDTVTTEFGKYIVVDFSERIQKDVNFANPTAPPTARILEYYQSGDVLSVNVEFFNPSTKDHLMSAVIRSGYSYIDYSTSIKMVDSARGRVEENVGAGERTTKWLSLYFAYGHNYNYENLVPFPLRNDLVR
jgi:outer membrane murein-binding lipoprotein Lpp